MKKTAREGVLAHELIHAYYKMIGKGINLRFLGTYRYTNQKDELIEVSNVPTEEIETEGLKGNRKYTENKIRKEHGWGKRVKY